ncbi:MAG: UDP-N-acetylglucosamine 1-carboxyvinyltransferase [Candidatus Eisenbacteria bacterium]|nr:UDP-N-acetylglucosamine 1-carboxyvinyltransferase [Candidatus Eisenbacteria bacterium]
MDGIVVRGGNRLRGSIRISGAKNATLPMMAATLLTRGRSTLTNVPSLRDVRTMGHVLRVLGAQVEYSDHSMTIDTSNCSYCEAPYELVKTMRASVCVLGPILAKNGRARVSLPGGCAWGPRPVDFHIRAMKELGADVELDHGYIVARAERLRGGSIHFDTSSVGATENAMMAAALAEGTTVITNAAREPEITALGDFLAAMGAGITGHGTDTITIEGATELDPADAEVIPDRIEVGTFMAAAAITGGDVLLEGARRDHCSAIALKLSEAGAEVVEEGGGLRVRGPVWPKSINVTTAPYPGFPTDMQAQMMALMTVADGTSVITDTIYADRFSHVPELRRLGADIAVDRNVAVVSGVRRLSGAKVMATDLRASAALILAGLVAEGETEVSRVYHIDRGYEAIEKKLAGAGAEIERVKE